MTYKNKEREKSVEIRNQAAVFVDIRVLDA